MLTCLIVPAGGEGSCPLSLANAGHTHAWPTYPSLTRRPGLCQSQTPRMFTKQPEEAVSMGFGPAEHGQAEEMDWLLAVSFSWAGVSRSFNAHRGILAEGTFLLPVCMWDWNIQSRPVKGLMARVFLPLGQA